MTISSLPLCWSMSRRGHAYCVMGVKAEVHRACVFLKKYIIDELQRRVVLKSVNCHYLSIVNRLWQSLATSLDCWQQWCVISIVSASEMLLCVARLVHRRNASPEWYEDRVSTKKQGLGQCQGHNWFRIYNSSFGLNSTASWIDVLYRGAKMRILTHLLIHWRPLQKLEARHRS